jgi:hypothetical protein
MHGTVRAVTEAERAELVRAAMRAAAQEYERHDQLSARVLRHAADIVNDGPLAKLGRMLR